MAKRKKGTRPAVKKTQSTKKRKPAMSRTQDLKEVEQGLQKANEAINSIVGKLREYESQIQGVTTDLFEKVGIVDQVDKLETQLRLARQRAQEKVNVHRAEASKLEQVKAYLVDKMTGEPPEAPDLPPVGDKPDEDEGEEADKGEDTEETAGADEGVPPAPEF